MGCSPTSPSSRPKAGAAKVGGGGPGMEKLLQSPRLGSSRYHTQEHPEIARLRTVPLRGNGGAMAPCLPGDAWGPPRPRAELAAPCWLGIL